MNEAAAPAAMTPAPAAAGSLKAPMLFCPSCGNLLVLVAELNRGVFKCRTCPHKHVLELPLVVKKDFVSKQMDDILGGEDAWKDVPKETTLCPHCGHQEGYFRKMQTRSADEPETTFYKCASTECGKQWKED